MLAWLRVPADALSPQIEGDLVKDGVCGLLIARKLKVSQPTASDHLRILASAGLIRGKRIKQWTFYQRDEAEVRRLNKLLATDLTQDVAHASACWRGL